MVDSTQQPLTISAALETFCFSHPEPGGPLRQWIEATVRNDTGSDLPATALVSAGGEDVLTRLSLTPGAGTYRVYAPVLWPDRQPVKEARLTLHAGRYVAESRVSVGGHRPWSLFLLGDDCVDYTWAYDDLSAFIADSAATTRSEIAACRETADAASANQNRHNLIHSVELAFFLQHAASEDERELAELVWQGRVSLSAYHNMTMTGDLSLPEAVRQFYPAVRFARKWGLALDCANHQETPTISWSQASLLAGAGVRYLVKSILAYDTPWNDRLEEPPIFIWEGPDGARLWVRRRNRDYVEGNFVLKGAEATERGVREKITEYEALGERYPFSAIGLVGCYGDLAPKTPELVAVKAAAIARYNSGEWAFPRLVNASHQVFWDEIEAQVRQRSLSLPAYRGDYGASWEAWPISLAADFAAWRQAQEKATAADSLAAICSLLCTHRGKCAGWWESYGSELEEGWRNLLLLSDHAWNGSSDGSRHLNAGLRRQWQRAAHHSFDEVTRAGLRGVMTDAPAGEGGVFVYNSLGWKRDGQAVLTGADLPAGPLELVDDVGAALPAQEEGEGQRRTMKFVARDLPALGYRCYALRRAETTALPLHREQLVIENEFYRVEVDGASGAIGRLFDKRRMLELVDRSGGWGLNQPRYACGGQEQPLALVSWEATEAGPAAVSLTARSRGEGIEVESRITLYQGLDRVDIANRVRKQPVGQPELLRFAFPFSVPGRRLKVEGPGVIYTPGDIAHGGEQRPGSGQAFHAVRHCLDIYGVAYGVLLAQLDNGIVQFGGAGIEDAPSEPDREDGTVFSLALGSTYNYREVSHDQGGATEFVFRYVLRAHDGGHDPAAMVRFGAEVANEPLVAQGACAPGFRSFVRVEPDGVLLVELKVADEGPERGLIARLWNPTQRGLSARLALAGPRRIRAAWVTDLVERDRSEAPAADGVAAVEVPARGYATLRLIPE